MLQKANLEALHKTLAMADSPMAKKLTRLLLRSYVPGDRSVRPSTSPIGRGCASCVARKVKDLLTGALPTSALCDMRWQPVRQYRSKAPFFVSMLRHSAYSSTSMRDEIDVINNSNTCLVGRGCNLFTSHHLISSTPVEAPGVLILDWGNASSVPIHLHAYCRLR